MLPNRSRFASLLLGVVVIAASAVADDDSGSGEAPLLRPGDRLAFLGGGFVERAQEHGVIEAELQCRRPDWELTVRNVGWSGDNVHGFARKRFDGPDEGYARLFRDLEAADADVVLVAYGFVEAGEGGESVERFEPGMTRLCRDLIDRDQRVVLMPPFAMPGVRVPGYEAAIRTCQAAADRVAKEFELPVLRIDWTPSDTRLTSDRLLPNRFGYQSIAGPIADRLVGGRACHEPSPELLERIAEKNELFFHHYRPQNETYLFLFRKHEQGQNAEEIDQFRPLIERADRAIWAAAKKPLDR